MKVDDDWPKAGLRWTRATNSKGAKFISPLHKKPRYLRSIVHAIDAAFVANMGKLKERKKFIDRAFRDMTLVATGLVGELRYVTMVECFDELEKELWWKSRNLPKGAIATLFLEIAKGRADWKSLSTPPFDYTQHCETAIMMDHFQKRLGELARDVKYEVYKRDTYSKVHLIEQGGIEYFTTRGLLVDLEVGQDIVASELVEDVHRLTIGDVSSQDDAMMDDLRPGTGMEVIYEEGDAPMDCTSD